MFNLLICFRCPFRKLEAYATMKSTARLAGGAVGALVPADLLDVPIDHDSAARGVPLGSGGFLVCDRSVSPVKLLRELLSFFELESCGKCTPCRVGTREARQVLDRFVAGTGTALDSERYNMLNLWSGHERSTENSDRGSHHALHRR